MGLRAIRISQYGGPEVLSCEAVARPEPTANEVAFRVDAADVKRDPESEPALVLLLDHVAQPTDAACQIGNEVAPDDAGDGEDNSVHERIGRISFEQHREGDDHGGM